MRRYLFKTGNYPVVAIAVIAFFIIAAVQIYASWPVAGDSSNCAESRDSIAGEFSRDCPDRGIEFKSSFGMLYAQNPPDGNDNPEPVQEKKEEPVIPIEPEEVKKDPSPGKKQSSIKVSGRTSGRKILLNFDNVDISEVLKMMGQISNKNIIIDDKVRGKVTISSSRKIPVESAVEVIRAILDVRGLALVETDHFIKVVPVREAVQQSVKVIIDGEDRLDPGGEVVTFLQQLENADVKEIKNVLQSLKSKDSDVVIFPPENILILRGAADEISGLIRIARNLDQSMKEIAEDGKEIDKDKKKPVGRIHVLHLENADANELASVLSRVPFSESAMIDTSPIVAPAEVKSRKASLKKEVTAPKVSAQSKQKLSIIANKETNSLIITANPDEYMEIKRIIKELDIVREQVYIESLIVEVSADSGWGLGVDWMLGNQSGKHIYGGSSIMGSPPNYTAPSSLAGKTLAVPLSTGFQLGYLADRSVLGFILLNASGSDRNFNILSTPQVLAIDNHESEINVGEEIPVPSNNRISDTGTQFFTFEYKSVGVKLKCKPHITNKESITMDVFLEVNSVLGQTTVLDSGGIIPPKLGRRDFKTKVTVLDGKTVVVGGLIRNSKIVEETRVPILGEIPLLGYFFKRKSVSDNKTNLLVFITPYIVTKQHKIDSLTDQKKEQQRRLKILSK